MRESVLYGFYLLRLVIVLTCTGYVHPDEFFQTVQVAERSLLAGRDALTWDWKGEHPIRSYGPVWLVFHLPVLLVRWVTRNEVQGNALYRGHRLVMLALSFALDYGVARLSSGSRSARLVFATLPATLTLSLHTFSNSVEAVIFALALLANHKSGLRSSAVLGLLFSIGCFLRISFLFFVIPLGICALRRRASHFGTLAAAFLFTSFILISVDRSFYGRWTLTPLNLVKYNIQKSNLALHGIHPRWLHLINLNLIVGPALVLAVFWTVYMKTQDVLKDVKFWTIASAMLLFSSQPHQEPRFLLPLALPVSILFSRREMPPKIKRVFWTFHIFFTICLVLSFEVAHQAGVVPTLSKCSSLNLAEEDRVIYWNTLMPPDHLYPFVITDLAGMAAPDASEIVMHHVKRVTTILVTPWANEKYLLQWCEAAETCQVELIASQWPHLDTDNLKWIRQHGLDRGMRLNMYKLITVGRDG